MITATTASLNPAGVAAFEKSVQEFITERKGVPPLSSDTHVHLTVFTPGIPGQRATAGDFLVPPSTGIIGENVAGCYQEFDVPHDELPPDGKIVAGERSEPAAGTWR